ncbi:MAG: hypothetical protein KDD69_16690 [Bdellovibrionales bacterium]|nr:hypothetical protein [Bdellovibrionales bacterium]
MARLFCGIFLIILALPGPVTAEISPESVSVPAAASSGATQFPPRYSLRERRFSLRERPHRVELAVVDDLESPLFSLNDLRRFRAAANSDLLEIGEEFSRIFRYRLRQRLTLRVLSPAQYAVEVGNAKWTNAMFAGGVITVPIRGVSTRKLASLRRSLRHEYVHAVLFELSGGRAPAWLEEGVAQLLEGPPNPTLGEALHARLDGRGAFALEQLDHGFVGFDPDEVTAAYAQSLFAVRSLINRFGFSAMRCYLERLNQRSDSEHAFAQCYRMSPSTFQSNLTEQLDVWRRAGRELP